MTAYIAFAFPLVKLAVVGPIMPSPSYTTMATTPTIIIITSLAATSVDTGLNSW